MIYIACPYSHPDAAVRARRFEIASKVAGHFMRLGHVVFSPITHGHPINQFCGVPTDWEHWEKSCKAFLATATSMIVVQLRGWGGSIGLAEEHKIAKDRGIPVQYLTEEQALALCVS